MRAAPDWLITDAFGGEWPDSLREIQAFEAYYFDPDSDLAVILAVEGALEVTP
ncbi:DUF7215 family protein [Streptomyces niveus]|uniref:DUF7215 family protein n=1 Tax=Streptomyces niveus TaxID=193462 RepID=UPI0035DAC01A